MNNFKLREVIDEFNEFVILPHIHPDGDTIGSSFALYTVLEAMGKTVYLVFDRYTLPANLHFLDKYKSYTLEEFTDSKFEYEAVFAVDSSDLERLGDRAVLCNEKKIINIDHHRTNLNYGHYNFVASDKSSTGELMYGLLTESGIEIDEEIAECLYTAIVTDTGSFKYSNTTSSTFEVASKLIGLGVDINKVNVSVYQTRPKSEIMLLSKALNTLDMRLSDKVGFVHVTQKMINEDNLSLKDTEGIVETIRDIESIEVAVFLREIDENKYKASVRSKNYYDVSKLALKYGGGGHLKAAGFVMEGPVSDIIDRLTIDISGEI